MSKYTDMFVVVPRVAYEAASQWERGNTHACYQDESFTYLQCRLETQTYEDDYLNCDYCYPTADDMKADYPELVGTIMDEDGNEYDKFSITTWGDAQQIFTAVNDNLPGGDSR